MLSYLGRYISRASLVSGVGMNNPGTFLPRTKIMDPPSFKLSAQQHMYADFGFPSKSNLFLNQNYLETSTFSSFNLISQRHMHTSPKSSADFKSTRDKKFQKRKYNPRSNQWKQFNSHHFKERFNEYWKWATDFIKMLKMRFNALLFLIEKHYIGNNFSIFYTKNVILSLLLIPFPLKIFFEDDISGIVFFTFAGSIFWPIAWPLLMISLYVGYICS